MKDRTKSLLVIAATVVFSAIGFRAWREHQSAVAYHELAVIVSSATNVTVYDVASFANGVSSNGVTSATSAEFPLEVFSSAAGGAEYRKPLGILWKGSSLAVLSLRNGTQRRARFSYYGGFFSFEGVPGLYAVLGGGGSQFHSTFERLIREQFVPKREGQKKNTQRAWSHISGEIIDKPRVGPNRIADIGVY